jgi:DNA-binding MarR family transcriptional regulator
MRKRNTILAALERFRDGTPDLWVNNIVTFLYVSENEGINIKELAEISRLSLPTASRAIRSFASPGDTDSARPRLGLVDIFGNPSDGRGKLLFLSEAGRALVKDLDGLIAQARPIRID